jgi:hypothetical protein
MQPVRLMDEPAQDVAPSHASRSAGRSGSIRRRVRCPEVEPTVRASCVVVSHVLAKHPLQVTAANHERPVEALAPDGPHPALGEGVRLRGSEWGEHDAHAVGREDGVEVPRVLGVAIADQELERPALGQVEGEGPGLLGHPRRIGMPRRSGYVDAPGVNLDDEQHVRRAQPRRLHGEAGRRPGHPWPGCAGTGSTSGRTAVGPGRGHGDAAAFGWPLPRPAPRAWRVLP